MGPHPVTSSKPNSSHSHYFPCITPWRIRASTCEERREMASIQSRTEGREMTSEERWLVQQIQACFLPRFLCNRRTTGKHWNRKTCSMFCHYRFIFSGLKTFLLEPGLASGLLPERLACHHRASLLLPLFVAGFREMGYRLCFLAAWWRKTTHSSLPLGPPLQWLSSPKSLKATNGGSVSADIHFITLSMFHLLEGSQWVSPTPKGNTEWE